MYEDDLSEKLFRNVVAVLPNAEPSTFRRIFFLP